MDIKWLPAQLAIVFVVLVVAFWGLELAISDDFKGDLAFWVQFLAGSSWPQERPYSESDLRFAIGVAAHFLLNFAPALGVLVIAWRLLVRERREIDLRGLLELRDETVRHEILARMDEEQRKALEGLIESAIEEAGKLWERDHLPDILSVEKVREILAQKYPLTGQT